MALLALLAGCREGPAPEVAGCSKDTDCKGDRICHERACIDPPAVVAPPASIDREASAPPPEPTPPPRPPPAPTPTTAQPAPPPPPPPVVPGTPSTTGERQSPCGCAPGDLVCTMKCAQRGNAADPSTWPAEPPP